MALEENKSFDSERQKTDQSLDAEREKTNVSINEAQARTERNTDRAVKEKRHEVDEATVSARTQVDTSRNPDGKTDRQIERRLADHSIEAERSHIDAAIVKERGAKSEIVADLLDQEREQTDKNLFDERAETDSEVVRASGRLSAEIAGHSKTKTALTSREEFLAIVSHDLRNPIGAASSCAEMLLEDSAYRDMDQGKLKYWIEFIKRNVDTSLRLISDLLDMERIAKDKLQLNLAYHSLESIIDEAVEGLAHLASEKKITIRPRLGTISVSVRCDRDRILQVLSNLIGNALKFTPAEGTISVETATTETAVRISVKDTGPGIPKFQQETLFERFTQLHQRDRSGLGLGLYISRMIVEAHGGEITVSSKEGQGSLFSVTIPLAETGASLRVH